MHASGSCITQGPARSCRKVGDPWTGTWIDWTARGSLFATSGLNAAREFGIRPLARLSRYSRLVAFGEMFKQAMTACMGKLLVLRTREGPGVEPGTVVGRGEGHGVGKLPRRFH